MDYSEPDSKRFGIRVYRGTLDDIHEEYLLKDILRERIDVAIIRFPTVCYQKIGYLEKLGIPFLIADTLVYYSVDLTKYSPNPLRNTNLYFHSCTFMDVAIIDSLVSRIFTDYKNHYTSNPFLKKDSILDGYKEWARYYCDAEKHGRLSWIVYQNDVPIAFLTCSFQENSCEGILYGVIEEASGRGIYGDLIRFSQTYFKSRNFQIMKVSTQVNNIAVQKVWAREGFSPNISFFTVHINSFIDSSIRQIDEIHFTISNDDVQNLMHLCLSANSDSIHLKDSVTGDDQFEDNLYYGIKANGILSRYFGMIYPGPDSFVIGYSYKPIKPLAVNERYRLRISFPCLDSDRGILKAVAQIYNPNNEICVLSYIDFMLRKKLFRSEYM